MAAKKAKKTTKKTAAKKAKTKRTPRKSKDATIKAAKDKAKEQAKAERAAAREAKQQAAADARAAAIKDGSIIVDGDVEYHATGDTTGTMIDRANALVATLKKSKIPVSIVELVEQHGGGHPQYLSMLSLLEAMGEVKRYRGRGDGAAGRVAYLHVSHVK